MTCLDTKDFVKLGKLVEKVALDPVELQKLKDDPQKYLGALIDIPKGHIVEVLQEPDVGKSYMIIPSKKDVQDVRSDMEKNGYAFPDEYSEIDPAIGPESAFSLRMGDYPFSRCARYKHEPES